MAEIKEVYFWVAFFVLVMLVAGYFRYYYQPSLSLSVNFASLPAGAYYPYQQIPATISVQNTGTALISNLSFGLYINGSLIRTYRITVPSGKTATFVYNFTPGGIGTYTISFVADPNSLYNINNRNLARSSIVVNVSQAEKAEPYTMFPGNGLIGENMYNMSPRGYGLALFLFNNTGANQFALTPSAGLNKVLYPALDVFYNYTSTITVGHAYYKSFALVALWIKGYLAPSALAEVAVGQGLNVTYDGNVTVMNLGNRTTMCTFYSNGWIKALASINGTSCINLVPAQKYATVNSLSQSRFEYKNTSIYNYSGFTHNYTYVGQWSLENSSILFQSVERGSNFSNVCYGSIVSLNNISYCNTYFLESDNAVLVKTVALLGHYNLSAWELSPQNLALNDTNFNVKLIKHYNLTGPSATFVTGFINNCYINNHILCYSTYWNVSRLYMGLVNEYNYSITLSKLGCYTYGTPTYVPLNQTLAPGQSASVSTNCYDNGTVISGVPLGLGVYLKLYYTNSTGGQFIANGDAELTTT